MVRYTFLILTCVLLSGIARAQDPQFSQYYSAPLYLNPGFTGITPQQRIVVNHRIQWPNLPQAFATYAASYDIFVEELRSGYCHTRQNGFCRMDNDNRKWFVFIQS
jgi:hypothetical protein